MREELTPNTTSSPVTRWGVLAFSGLFKPSNLRLIWQFLPILLVFVLILTPLSTMVLEKIDPRVYSKIASWDAPALKNSPSYLPRPSPNFHELMAGEWQHQFENWFTLKIPFRAAIVRTHNQIYYDLFSASYMYLPIGLAIGKNDYLYTRTLITDAYCKLPQLHSKQALNEWAGEIQNLASFFKHRGQNFFYMMSPSKAEYYPEYFPKNYAFTSPCDHHPYIPLANILDKNKVNFVDARKIVIDAKPTYGHLLFPHGGLHWTMLGAALAVKDFFHQLSPYMETSLPDLTYTYKTIPIEVGGDTDLLELANLLRPNTNYPTPLVTINYPQVKKTKPLKLAVVGDSLSGNFILSLINTKLFDQIDFYFYYDKGHSRSVNSGPLVDVSPEDSDKFKALLAADVVILEENEGIRGSKHSQQLFESLLGRAPIFAKYIKSSI